MVCAGVIIHFRSNEKYEKYIRFLLESMILLLLLEKLSVINGIRIGSEKGDLLSDWYEQENEKEQIMETIQAEKEKMVWDILEFSHETEGKLGEGE